MGAGADRASRSSSRLLDVALEVALGVPREVDFFPPVQGIGLALFDQQARLPAFLVVEPRESDVDHEDLSVEARSDRAFGERMADRDPLHLVVEEHLSEMLLERSLIPLGQPPVPERSVLPLHDAPLELGEILEFAPDAVVDLPDGPLGEPG